MLRLPGSRFVSLCLHIDTLLILVQAEKEEREESEKSKRAEIDARETKRREAALGPSKGKGKAKK